jgi:hypothetical protein
MPTPYTVVAGALPMKVIGSTQFGPANPDTTADILNSFVFDAASLELGVWVGRHIDVDRGGTADVIAEVEQQEWDVRNMDRLSVVKTGCKGWGTVIIESRWRDEKLEWREWM